jgi:hypothetical protein
VLTYYKRSAGGSGFKTQVLPRSGARNETINAHGRAAWRQAVGRAGRQAGQALRLSHGKGVITHGVIVRLIGVMPENAALF